MLDLEFMAEASVRGVEEAHATVSTTGPLASAEQNMVGIQPSDIVDNLVVEMQGRVLLHHPIIDVDYAAMGDTAAAIRTRTDGSTITGSSAGNGGGEAEAVAVEGAPLGSAKVVREAIKLGFPEKKLIGEVRGDVEITGAEKVEENAEAIRVAINEDF